MPLNMLPISTFGFQSFKRLKRYVKVISIEFHEMPVLFALIHVKMCTLLSYYAQNSHHSPKLSSSSFSWFASERAHVCVCACVHVLMRIFVNVSMYCTNAVDILCVCVRVLVMLERGCWCWCEMNDVLVRASTFGLNTDIEWEQAHWKLSCYKLHSFVVWQHVNSCMFAFAECLRMCSIWSSFV